MKTVIQLIQQILLKIIIYIRLQYFYLQMNRGVRADIRASKENKKAGKVKLNRSKSKSRSKSPQRGLNKDIKKLPKTSRDKNNRSRSRSIIRSNEKKVLQKSASGKKIKRGASQPKMGNNNAKINSSPIKKTNPHPNINNIVKTPNDRKANIGKEISAPMTERKPEPMIKQQQKDIGLITFFPEHEKIMLKPIDNLDEVHEKFLQMISNDNDASYVMNALPEFRDIKKDDDSTGRDFISGRITRLSGVFQGLTVQKIANPLRKTPHYYTGPCGKNLQTMKITLQTKFKIQVDIGFLQYSLDGDKLTIFRIYISRIYRKMNYTAFVYIQILKSLAQKHPGADKWSIFILERNINIHKFFKFMGLKIEKVITDSKNKNNVDYYQEFTIKKKELQTAISAFK